MRIMTLNCGSSSVKYSLWSLPDEVEICRGIAERVGMVNSLIRQRVGSREVTYDVSCPTYEIAIKSIFDLLIGSENHLIKNLAQINAIGHRVVHGGAKFTHSVVIDGDVIEAIEQCSTLAPLHNPPNLQGIRAAMNLIQNIPQVAIFDTAFLSTMPPHAYIYAVPYRWYESYGVRKYGFHGSSHSYVSRRAAELLGKTPSEINIVTLHIGNGVSVTAVKKGSAYDHSMGFTPLEGAVMGTRSGDLDVGVALYIMETENLTPTQMSDILNKKSGLLGITGKYVDRRDVIKAAENGDDRAKLAIEVECHRLKKFIGAYAAAMGGIDALVFTAGVGENSPLYRRKICEGLEFLGIEIDPEKNTQAIGGDVDMEIGRSSSPVRICVIPTNEELIFVREVMKILRERAVFSGSHQ